jgi:NADH-quinone oxidoreductase subunit C
MIRVASVIEGLNAQLTEADFGKTGYHWNIAADAGHVVTVAERLYASGFFLEDLCALDVEEGYQLVYHFSSWNDSTRITVRLLVPHDRPEAPSISSIFSGASWHERECFDFHGIKFTNHPDLKPLLLPEDADFHPLRKEAEARRSLKKLFPPSPKPGAEETASAKVQNKSAESEG